MFGARARGLPKSDREGRKNKRKFEKEHFGAVSGAEGIPGPPEAVTGKPGKETARGPKVIRPSVTISQRLTRSRQSFACLNPEDVDRKCRRASSE